MGPHPKRKIRAGRKDPARAPNSGMPKAKTKVRLQIQTSGDGGEGYRIFFQDARDAMFMVDVRTREIVDVNRAAVRLMGHSRRTLLSMKADQLHPEKERAMAMKAFRRDASMGSGEVESMVVTSKGKNLPVWIRGSVIHLEGKTYLIGIFRNISKQNKREERLRSSESRAHILSKAALTLLRATDPLKRYHFLLDHARKETGSRYGFIGYIDSVTGYLVAPTMTKEIWDECKMHDKDIILKEFKGLWGRVLTHKEIVLSNDPSHDPRRSRQPYGHIRILNFLGVPCLHRGKVIGMIALANKDHGYTPEDEKLIFEFGQLVTVAILDHHKLEEKQQAQMLLKATEACKSNLLSISRTLHSCNEVSEAWEAVSESIMNTVGAKAASLFVPRPGMRYLKLMGSSGLSEEYVRTLNGEQGVPVVHALMGQAFTKKKPELCCDTENDPRFAPWRDLVRREGYRSIIAMPLMIGKSCLGVAVFYFEEPRNFVKNDLNLIQLSINQLTPALARIEYDRKISESEEKYRMIFKNSPIGICHYDRAGVIRTCNDSFLDIMSFSRKKAIGSDLRSLIQDDALKGAMIAPLMGRQGRFEGDYSLGPDKECAAIIKADFNPILSKDGSLFGAIGIVEDETDQKRARKVLLKERNEAQRYLDIAKVILLVVDADQTVSLINKKGCEVLGYDEQEIVGKNWFDCFLPERLRENVRRVFGELMAGSAEPLEYYENSIVTRGGMKRLLAWHNTTLRDEAGHSIGTLSSGEDITDRKMAEEALRESEVRYRAVVEDQTELISRWRPGGILTFVNAAYARCFGKSREELVGQSFFQFIPPEEREEVRAHIASLTQKNPMGSIEHLLVQSTDERVWQEWRDRALFDDRGQLVEYQSVGRDITKEKRAEMSLRESEEKYRTLFESAPIGILHFDNEGTCRTCNDVFVDIMGAPREKILHFNLLEKLEDSRMKTAVAAALSGRKGHFEGEYTSVVGNRTTTVRAEFTPTLTREGKIMGGMGVYEDITDRKRLEQELSRAQRLEAAGRVAGQIAHDFNNLLSPLMAYPDLISLECKDGDPILPLVDQMRSVAIQMAEINQQLLTLGRRGHYNLKPVDLNRLLNSLLTSLSLPHTLGLRKTFQPDLMQIKGGTAQLTRAFTNLIYNARDAMAGIGDLSITTGNIYLDGPLKGYQTIQKGEYVRVDIQDSGTGIDPDIIHSIFEPFFTTKNTDKKRGSGLGLSVVRAVVEDHNGYFGLETQVGAGSTFSLYFPITRETEIENEPLSEEYLHGDERVLVVDDDPIQREVLRRLLTQLGYEVHDVESGESAVSLVQDSPQDILVLDMVMDGMDGTETFRKIREIYPLQKALILSGYAESARVTEAQRLGAGEFIRKPIDLGALAKALRNELDSK